MELIRAALLKNLVQLVIRPGSAVEATWTPDGVEDTQLGPVVDEDDVEHALSNVALREVSPSMNPKAMSLLAHAFVYLSNRGLAPTYFLCPDIEQFLDWVGMPTVVPLREVGGVSEDKYFMGIRLRQIDERYLPADKLVVLGAKLPEANVADAVAGVVVPYE